MFRLTICLLLSLLPALHGTAQNTKKCTVEIYLLKSRKANIDTADYNSAYFVPTKADLQAKPVISYEQVLNCAFVTDGGGYETMSITLSKNANVADIKKMTADQGLQFALVVNGDIVYGGYFWKPKSPYTCNWMRADLYTDEGHIIISPAKAGYGFTGSVSFEKLNQPLLECFQQPSE